MDIERTMEFLVNQAARADARTAKHEQRMDRFDEQMDRRFAEADKRMTRLERQMKGVQKLLLLGAGEIADIRRLQRETQKEIKELAAAQKKTDRTLEWFMRSFGKGNGNGRR